MQFPDSDFWQFSIHFYQIEGVEQSCLELQNRFNLNVNLILFCYWLALEKKQTLTIKQWIQLIDTASGWDEINHSLRASRNTIKHSVISWPEDFKQQTIRAVLDIELCTEHMQQLSLEQCWKKMDTSHTSDSCESSVSNNINSYLSASRRDIADEIIKPQLLALSNASRVYMKSKHEKT